MSYKVSVIIPALNEESHISAVLDEVLRTFERLNITGEIIVVNDGSIDNTEKIVQEYVDMYSSIRIIKHNAPKGIGKSYWDGFIHSKGEFITWVPGDAENDSYELLRYLPLMDNVDILIPFVYNWTVRPLHRRVLSKIYRLINIISFGILVNYLNGTALYRREVLENINLKNTGFFFQTELLIKSIRDGYLYAEVPYALKVRIGDSSKALTLKTLLGVISGYVKTIISFYIFHDPKKPLDPRSVSAQRKGK